MTAVAAALLTFYGFAAGAGAAVLLDRLAGSC